LNNAFHFKKALMEDHFNADYMESEKYPKSTFKGTIDNISTLNFNNDGVFKVTVSGNLTIHGVTKAITAPGLITIKAGKISATSVFRVKVRDYNISIPSTTKNNIAESVELTLRCSYEKKS
jgi:polyisoprenoid-binding protein YceI